MLHRGLGEEGIAQASRLQKGAVGRCKQNQYLASHTQCLSYKPTDGTWTGSKAYFQKYQNTRHSASTCVWQQREISSYFQAPLVTRKENQYVTASWTETVFFTDWWTGNQIWTSASKECRQDSHKGYEPSREPIWACRFNATNVKALPDSCLC